MAPKRRASDEGPSASSKKARDKGRSRKGQTQKKRIYTLMDPTLLAFPGWDSVPSPWTLSTCERYIEWCHIGKKFELHRHKQNRDSNKANLVYCTDENFLERCIEVNQVLYGDRTVERNEVPLYLARMVYAEIALGKEVDWRTVNPSGKVKVPTTKDIPRTRIFPGHGLGPIRRRVVIPDDQVVWSPQSSTDSRTDWIPPHQEVPETEEEVSNFVYGSLMDMAALDEPNVPQEVAPPTTEDPMVNDARSSEKEVQVHMEDEEVQLLKAQLESALMSLGEKEKELKKKDKDLERALARNGKDKGLEEASTRANAPSSDDRANPPWMVDDSKDILRRQLRFCEKKLEVKEEELKTSKARVEELESRNHLDALERIGEIQLTAIEEEFGKTPAELKHMRKMLAYYKQHISRLEDIKANHEGLLNNFRTWMTWHKKTQKDMCRKGECRPKHPEPEPEHRWFVGEENRK